MCSTKMTEEEFLDGMSEYYSEEQELKYGVLAIELKLI